MKARISQLHKTEAEWKNLNAFCPSAGEIIIYDPDQNFDYARLKVGDGITNLKDLPFFVDSATQNILQQQKFDIFIDGGRITGESD
jgi:hypothetical protein